MNDTSTLVDRYLDDLARMLTALPPAERADALGSVREHVDDALGDLGRPATDDDVTAILGRLGTPADVASALLADTPGTAAYAPAPVTPPVAPAPLPGDGDAALALGLAIFAVVVPFIGLPAAIAAIVLARRARRAGTRRDGIRVAGLVLGLVALVGQLLIIAGLVGTLTLRTEVGSTEGPTPVANVVGVP